MTYKKSSVAVRLSVKFTIVLAISIILLSILFQLIQQRNMRNRQNEELLRTARELSSQVQRDSDSTTFDIPYFISYVIYETSTKSIIATNDPFLPVLSSAEEKCIHKIIPNFFMDGDLNLLYCTNTTLIKENEQVTVQVSIDMTNDSASRMWKGLPRTIIVMLIPILIISFLSLLFITRSTLKPVTDITKAAENISSTNLDTLLPLSNKNDELDYLAKTFNSLFKQLKADFDKEHAFTSNVSHELKTPVAVILGQANLLRRWGKDDPAQLEKSLGTIIDEAHSMQSVISNLLMMTHMENGTYEFNIEEFKIFDLFEKIKTEFATVAPKVKITINTSDTGAVIKSDKELIRQVMVVVISNSVRYAGESCSIELKYTDSKISVTDDGKGFSPEILPHVFERFYRGDKAHNRSDGGSGLGLSIAKSIIDSLGGTITASNANNGGACVTIGF